MTYNVRTYEFTAFEEADLLQAGDHNINCGDTFTMLANATVCISVTDNDGYLSGDSCHNENANDHYGQQASITDALTGAELGNGGQIYGESYFWVHDQHGNWYMMIEIEQEGTGDDYFAFHNYYGVPPEGSVLTVHSQCNITDWEPDYKCLTAGPKLETGSIKGRVFEDADCDNTEKNADTGGLEEGIENVTVELLDAHGNVIATDVTGANGWYKFDDLAPNAEYTVRFVKPEGLDFVQEDVGSGRFDSDANVTTGESFTIHLSSGENVKNVDAGLKPNTGSIEGRVFCDLDCDGIEDKGITTITKGENLLSDSTFENGNHTVYNVGQFGAWYDAGNDSGDIITGKDAYHHGNPHGNEIFELDRGSILCQEFDVVEGGKYCLTFDVYDNACLEKWDDKFIVKINGHEVETVMVTKDDHIEIVLDLDPGQNRIDFVSLSSVSGKGPGIDNIEIRQEIVTTTEGEPGKEGVTVNLLDASGAVIATTTTDADGNYKFADVPEGDYTVEVVAPAGQEFTFQNVGGDDTMDSDVDANGQVTVTVKGGEVTGDVDAGLKEAKLGALSGRYFCDDDGDGLDNDGSSGTLGSSTGIQNVLVTLLDANGDPVLVGGNPVSTLTDSTGFYEFTDLTAGTYGVKFTDAVSGKVLTTPNVATDPTDQFDSDAINLGGGMSEILGIEVLAGQTTEDNDAGVFELAALGDFVFFDDNGNGIQDAGESGVQGIEVTLTGGGANGVIGDGDDTTETVTTDANGFYQFTGLNPGEEYKVTFNATSLPANFAFTDANQGGNDALDSDADIVTGMTQIVTLAPGENNTTLDAGIVALASLGDFVFEDKDADGIQDPGETGIADAEVKLLADLDNDGQIDDVLDTTTTNGIGFYQFTGLRPGDYKVMFVNPGFDAASDPDQGGDDTVDSDGDPNNGLMTGIINLEPGENDTTIDQGFFDFASLGDFVFNDRDRDGLQDAGEEGIEGATVKLLDSNGDEIDMVETDANGFYEFTGLRPGDYQVMFLQPVGFAGVSPANQGGDDAADSDGDPANGLMTDIVTLESGENNPTLDQGFFNVDPEAEPADVEACYDEPATVMVNFSDVDGPNAAITQIAWLGADGVEGGGDDEVLAVSAGDTISFIGTEITVTLDADGKTFTFNGEAEYADLLANQTGSDVFLYTVEDGAGNSASAEIGTTFKGATDTLDKIAQVLPDQLCFTIADIPLDAPQEQIDAFFQLTLETDDPDFAFLDNLLIDDAYCVDVTKPFFPEEKVTANVSILADGFVDPGLLAPEAYDHFDEINWVLNNRDHADLLGFNDAEIQGAIWGLTNNNTFVDEPFFGSTANAIAAQQVIETLGDGFELGFGDKVAVLLEPVAGEPTQQPFVVALDVFWEDCIC